MISESLPFLPQPRHRPDKPSPIREDQYPPAGCSSARSVGRPGPDPPAGHSPARSFRLPEPDLPAGRSPTYLARRPWPDPPVGRSSAHLAGPLSGLRARPNHMSICPTTKTFHSPRSHKHNISETFNFETESQVQITGVVFGNHKDLSSVTHYML